MPVSQSTMLPLAILCGALGAQGIALAQETPPPEARQEGDVLIFNHAAPPGPSDNFVFFGQAGPIPSGGTAAQPLEGAGSVVVDRTFTFISAMGPGAGAIVKEAPYSAEATTEVVQTLADGNRIVHKNSSTIYRDSQGRTRRDQRLETVGPFAAGGEPPNLSFITDPVAGAQYVLDHNAMTARKSEYQTSEAVPAILPPLPPQAEGAGAVRFFRSRGAAGMAAGAAAGRPALEFHRLPAPTTEDLGKQLIEGLETVGSRSVVTLEAGAIGNELPIRIVSERWYSPELQVVVLSTNNDPRAGTTTYRLTNLSRNEPSLSLFEVPADYTLLESPMVSERGFADCAAAGNPVQESLPRQCRTADGQLFIEPPAGPVPFNISVPQP